MSATTGRSWRSMALAAKAALEAEKLDAIADRGYFNGAELLACHEEGITATVPKPETSGNRKKGMFVKADFAYDAASDVYRCPAGKALTYRYTREEDGLMLRRYWQNDCQHCPLNSRCTTGKERRITRWEHEHLVEAMYARMEQDPELMTKRRSTVEHPFGTIKAWMGATHFQMRRLRNVRTEMALHVLAYNIKRMIELHRHRPAPTRDPHLRIGNIRSAKDRSAAGLRPDLDITSTPGEDVSTQPRPKAEITLTRRKRLTGALIVASRAAG